MRTDGRDDANGGFLRTRLKVARIISASRGRVHQFKDLQMQCQYIFRQFVQVFLCCRCCSENMY